MKALITGIAGFAGSYLAEYLLNEKKIQVYGAIIKRWQDDLGNIEHLLDKVTLIECDIRDSTAVTNALEKAEPDYIFHLAAQSFVPTSWNMPSETLTTNIIGELNLFEAIRKLKLDPIIQVAGSSEEYGLVYENEVPISEDNPLRPLSPYAVSKIGQDFLGYQYHKSYGLKIVRTRAFNHTGPRRGEVFVCSTFAKQIVEIEKDKKPPVISVGNLEAKRDFTDVRDMVKAYVLAVERCQPGEVYNICSSKTISIKEILDILISCSTKKDEIKIEQDPERLRPSDVLILKGDASKFKTQTGWEPKIPLTQTLSDLLDWWRGRIK